MKTAHIIAESLKDAKLLTTAQTTRAIVFDGDQCICMTEDMLNAWWANLDPERKAMLFEADLEGEIRDEAPDAIGFTPAAPLQCILIDGLRELGLARLVDRINGVESTWNATLAAPLLGLGERRILLGGQLQPQPAPAFLEGVIKACDSGQVELAGRAFDQLPDAVGAWESAQGADGPVKRGRRELDRPGVAVTDEEAEVHADAASPALPLMTGPGLRQQGLASAADRTLVASPDCGPALPTHAPQSKRSKSEEAVEGFSAREGVHAHA